MNEFDVKLDSLDKDKDKYLLQNRWIPALLR